MFRKVISLAFVSVLLLVMVCSPVMAETVTGVNGDLELQMTVENTIIVIGREVDITLTLKNNGNDTIILGFPDAQVFDIFLLFYHIRVNAWSRDKLFPQWTIDVELEPGETYSRTLKWNFYFWDGKTYTAPSPGDYSLVGVVVGIQDELRVVTPELPITLISGPKADFTYSPSVPRLNQTVTFDASASQPGSDGTHVTSIVSYAWKFGDGNITTTSGPTVAHKFAMNDTYTVTLNVTDSQGFWDSTSKIITVHSPVHDVTISEVTPKPDMDLYVYPGWVLYISVTAKNVGDFTENFTVKACYDGTVIGTKSVTNLAPGASIRVDFKWTPSDTLVKFNRTAGKYHAYPVKGEAVLATDANPGDNELVDGKVAVIMTGDANQDGIVSAGDLVVIGKYWGMKPLYYAMADVNFDGLVSAGDLVPIGKHWGEIAPDP